MDRNVLYHETLLLLLFSTCHKNKFSSSQLVFKVNEITTLNSTFHFHKIISTDDVQFLKHFHQISIFSSLFSDFEQDFVSTPISYVFSGVPVPAAIFHEHSFEAQLEVLHRCHEQQKMNQPF